jgi:type I restriction enzyme, S subunit
VRNFFGNDARFIFYLLRFVDLRRFASGSGVPTLNRNDAHDDPVWIPRDVDEQRAISAVLDDIGAELGVLGTRLEKARQVKEGMMQNLLTGRIRLV